MATAQWSDKNIENMGYTMSGVNAPAKTGGHGINQLPIAAGDYKLTVAIVDGLPSYTWTTLS